MTNKCRNTIVLSGNSSILEKLLRKFDKIIDGKFNYRNYHLMFEDDVSDVQGDDWGPEWFDFKVIFEDEQLKIQGDSLQVPPVQLFEMISEEYEINCSMIYEEPVYDFAGTINWESGDMVSNSEFTYWEYQFQLDEDKFYNLCKDSLLKQESIDDWINNLKIEDWKIQPIFKLERLANIWKLKTTEII